MNWLICWRDKPDFEDLTVMQNPLIKTTKAGEKRVYYRWVASWREGKKVRVVYLGSINKMSEDQAFEKAKHLKTLYPPSPVTSAASAISKAAVPYNTTIGPYNVSFDMGFSGYYTSISEPWIATETLSGQKLERGSIDVYKNGDHTGGIAIIGVMHNDVDQSYSSALGVGEVARPIDGVSGSITSVEANGITIFMAAYHPAFDPKRVNVTIISNYPWDDGTLKLLQTIHVANKKSSSTRGI